MLRRPSGRANTARKTKGNAARICQRYVRQTAVETIEGALVPSRARSVGKPRSTIKNSEA